MLYQFQNSLRDEPIKVLLGENLTFPPHLHDNFEFILVTEGNMKIIIEKEKYDLTKGEALLIFPNRVHEFISEGESSDLVCLFSPKLVSSFSKTYLNYLPRCSKFTPSPLINEKMRELSKKDTSLLETKGILYLLCAEFDTGREYVEKDSSKDRSLIAKIFRFVEKNYARDASLRALSKETSHHYVYLSRYFKSYTGISFIDYVNSYRVNEACYLIENSHGSILEIAYECGFDSLRNFNRVFKKIKGMTPSEYKKGLARNKTDSYKA